MEIEEKYWFWLVPTNLADPSLRPPISAEQWTANVRRLLRKMEATDVGGLLLAFFQWNGRWVKIAPYWEHGVHLPNPCNANTTARAPHKDGGRWYYSVVLISPERYAAGTPCAERRKREGGATVEDHETLFHELVHAMRHVAQEWSEPEPLKGGLREHSNFEELIAVLLTNIYASSNGKTVLRSGHRGHRPLPDELNDSFKFFQISAKAYDLVGKFYWAHEPFCKLLAKVDTPFNPIRAYHQDPAKARQLSQSARAADRDARAETLTLLEGAFWLPRTETFEDFMAP